MIIDPTETHTVPFLQEPIRLQEYGINPFSAIETKSALKKALKKNRITVNGVLASTATFIHGGEQIVLLAPKEVSKKKQLVFPLKVLFEDNHLAVIHKPAGIVVSGNSFKTVAHALKQNLASSAEADATDPQPVHRLDYATTGVLLVGKTSSAIRTLNKMFEDKEVQKTYYAITIGKMHPTGQITDPVDDKVSKSIYTVLETVQSKRFDRLNLVKLEPLSGRRHQLRQHMASIGHPILGDKEYGIEPLILNGKGLYLHAYSLKFKHPFSGNELLVKSGLPLRFQRIFPKM